MLSFPSSLVQGPRAHVAGGLLLLLAACSTACSDSGSSEAPELRVGLLLPFTGNDSATSNSFERAVIFAAGRVNDSGGIAGQRLRVISKDTHSELERSESALHELAAAGVRAVIGAESADIATALSPEFASSGILFVSPLIGAADDTQVDCGTRWLRLAPSARSLGEGLAKQLSAEHITSAAVLSEANAYDGALGSALARRFTTLGGRITLARELDGAAQSYAATVNEVLATQPQAIVLTTSARTAALVVNEFDAEGRAGQRWFLSPRLKTELFVQNVPADALEGALGVAPEIYDHSAAFPAAFSRRWSGDLPLEGAYFYYDALSALAFGFAAEVYAAPTASDPDSLTRAVFDVVDSRGEALGWNDVEQGVARLAQGDDINYSGLTGPMLLTACGTRQLGVTSTWQVRSGVIIADE